MTGIKTGFFLFDPPLEVLYIALINQGLMSELQLTSKQYFRQITIIHSALIIG